MNHHEKKLYEITFANLATCRESAQLPARFTVLHSRALYDDGRKNWVVKMKILTEAECPMTVQELFLTDNLNMPLNALLPGEDMEHLTSVEAWGNGSVVHIFLILKPVPVQADPAPEPPAAKKKPGPKAKAKA